MTRAWCPRNTLLLNHISNKTIKPFKIEKLIKVRVSDGPDPFYNQETMNISTMVILLLSPSERISIWFWID